VRVSQGLSRLLLVISALPWAAGWVMLGTWLLIQPAGSAGSDAEGAVLPDVTRWTLGVTSIAAGQLVFMCFVADRVFPGAARTPVWVTEIGTCAVLFIGVLGLIGQLAASALMGAG